MVKFTAKREGVNVIGLGLTRENINRLINDNAIMIKGEEMGRPEVGEIYIFFGETEEQIAREFREAGFIASS